MSRAAPRSATSTVAVAIAVAVASPHCAPPRPSSSLPVILPQCPDFPTGNAIGYCSGGGCGQVCTGAFRNCNLDFADGCEVNLGTDSSNCGNCGIVVGGSLTMRTCSGVR